MADTPTTSNKIRIANPPLEGYDKTYLTSNVTSGTVVNINVISTSGDNFKTTGTDDYYVLVGNYGDEKAEIALVDASDSDATTLEVDSLSYSHSASDPVTFIPYNQIKIYGGSGKTNITTIDIDPSSQYTTYIYEGTEYSTFYIAYLHEDDSEISAYSEAITSASFGRTSAKRVIKSGLRRAVTTIDENEDGLLSWSTAIEILNDGLDEIMTRKKKWIFLHKVDETSTDTVASTAYISIPSDLAYLEFITVDDNKLNWMSRLDYDYYTKSGVTVSTGSPESYTMKNNKYYLYPTPNSAYDVGFEYFKYPTEIDDLTDNVDKEFTTILSYYCGYQFATLRQNEQKASELYAQFEKELEKQVIQFSGPDQLGDSEKTEQSNTNYWQ